MDPLSLSLGIAGILPLIATAIKTCKEYVDTVRSARESIATLVMELEALQFNVSNLHDLLKGDVFDDSPVRFHETSVLLSCSAACEAKLRSLCKKLAQEANKKRSRFLWPFTEKEYEKTVQEIRNFTNWMQFALSVDGCRLLSRTSDDVLKLMGQQLEQFRTIQTLEAGTLRILDLVEEQQRAIQVNTQRESRRNILNWISTAKHYQKHQLIQASRAQNTGMWILQRHEFIQWRNDTSSSNVLVAHGIQGSGKTNLAYVRLFIAASAPPTDDPARSLSTSFLNLAPARFHLSRSSTSTIRTSLVKVRRPFYAVSLDNFLRSYRRFRVRWPNYLRRAATRAKCLFTSANDYSRMLLRT